MARCSAGTRKSSEQPYYYVALPRDKRIHARAKNESPEHVGAQSSSPAALSRDHIRRHFGFFPARTRLISRSPLSLCVCYSHDCFERGFAVFSGPDEFSGRWCCYCPFRRVYPFHTAGSFCAAGRGWSAAGSVFLLFRVVDLLLIRRRSKGTCARVDGRERERERLLDCRVNCRKWSELAFQTL